VISNCYFSHVCLSVCLSVWVPACVSIRQSPCNNSASTGRVSMEFDYMRIFRKSVEKIHFSINSDKNNGYFTWKPMYICDTVSLNSPQNENCFRQTLYRKSKHIFCSITFSQYCAICEIAWYRQTKHARKYNSA